jgi:Protein of Unknown function (DUF2784)
MLLADFVLLAHAAFVAFALLGGWLALRWRWLVWVHVPALVWGAAVELFGWPCPLTRLEDSLRGTDSGDFVGRTLLGLLYPDGLTRGDQVLLGAGLLLVNAIAYGVRAGSFARIRRNSR